METYKWYLEQYIIKYFMSNVYVYYTCHIRYTFTRASIAPFQINASILAWSMPIVQCTFIYIHTVATFAGFSVSIIAFTHVSSRFVGTYLITPSTVFQAFVNV